MELANFVGLFIMIGLVLITAFFQFSVMVWTVCIGVALVVLTYLGYLSPASLTIFWLGYIVAALFANLHSLRQRYLVLPALQILKKRMPAISDTEREAIEAGHTFWEKELFSGRPNWHKLFAFPCPALKSEEQQFLDHQVEQLCTMLNDWQIVYEKQNLPEEV